MDKLILIIKILVTEQKVKFYTQQSAVCAKESNVISKHIENKEVHLHHERHHLIHPERRTGGIQPGRRQALRQTP